jgi:hypothetical protein
MTGADVLAFFSAGQVQPPGAEMDTSITFSLAELEDLVRRVVREELHRLAGLPASDASASILHDWRHEGPDDPAADEELAQEAEALSRQCRESPEDLVSLEDFERELARAEAAGELPG